jgi:hypothetical protein
MSKTPFGAGRREDISELPSCLLPSAEKFTESAGTIKKINSPRVGFSSAFPSAERIYFRSSFSGFLTGAKCDESDGKYRKVI